MSIDVRREAAAAASTVGLSQTWELDLDYVTYARFASLVAERGLPHTATRHWPTERMTLDGLFPYAIVTHRDRTERCALLDLGEIAGDECVAHVSLEHQHARVRIAAGRVESLAETETWLRELYPETQPVDAQRVPIAFWANGRRVERTSRTIDVPSWDDVSGNYPATVRTALGAVCTPAFRPSSSGQLILWHGPPGTGKTSALRALAWEWRDWCRLHYITDPEAFFGTAPTYMLEVLLDEEPDDTWRLLVLEDTGELLSADAKLRTGQALSRLLNVVDGMLGQGLRVLVLVTTNESLGALNPAVSRPGRCASAIEFVAFPAPEAAAWLASHEVAATSRTATLAELFALREGVVLPTRQQVGFA